MILSDCAPSPQRGGADGDTLEGIRKGLGRLSSGEPASVVGAVVDRLLAIGWLSEPAA